MRKAPFRILALLLFASLLPTLHAQAPVPDSPAIEKQVDAMLAKMTLEQKIDLIGGEDSMFIRAVPSAGFPRLKMSDGPMGVRTWGPTTAYPGGIGLAATWDPALAERIGVELGRDARARGVHFLLAPGVDIYRAAMNGRNFEYFGEDPFLDSKMAVAYIDGVQSQGVVATVKHYAGNNSEFDRHGTDSIIGERALHEIYLPTFEAAVKDAHVGAVMDSYNLLNGEHMTQNGFMNDTILKKRWGFNGIVMSDWDATYDGVAAANGGLDLEMPSGKFMNRQTLLPAIRAGKVSTATIDDKVRSIFRTAIRFGFLNRPQLDPSIPLYSQAGRKAALQGALESAVLLRNKDGFLPLDPAKIKTLAVIGPDAWPAISGGGGSSQVEPFTSVSFLEGLSDALAGKVNVVYARGLPSVYDLFQQTSFDNGGLKMETFSNANFSGKPASVKTSDHIDDYHSNEWLPAAKQKRSVRWTGTFTPKASGQYLFVTAAGGRDAYTLRVGGKALITQPVREGEHPESAAIALTAGTPVSLQLDYLPHTDSSYMGLGIRAVADLVPAEARALAASADAVFLSVGFDPTTESEGMDRTFDLPWGQDDLIQTIASANPKTVVAITAGGNVGMTQWIDRVSAVLHNWYPGQEGGTAMAQLLLGEHSPEGKLPASFPASFAENPVHDSYYPAPGTNRITYSEGVFVGYRYYTTEGKKPLFPFGFGLSYTTFSFSNLKVSPESARADEPITVSFDVANTGKVKGAEVAQLYVGDPSARVKRPAKELKGFEKVRLAPGESVHVTFKLDRRDLSYWDVKHHGWQADPGRFVVYAGDSSENTPLTQDFTITQ